MTSWTPRNSCSPGLGGFSSFGDDSMTRSNPQGSGGSPAALCFTGFVFGRLGQTPGCPLPGGFVPSQGDLPPPSPALGHRERFQYSILCITAQVRSDWLIFNVEIGFLSTFRRAARRQLGWWGDYSVISVHDGANELDPTTYGEICLLCTKMNRKMRFLLKIS